MRPLGTLARRELFLGPGHLEGGRRDWGAAGSRKRSPNLHTPTLSPGSWWPGFSREGSCAGSFPKAR